MDEKVKGTTYENRAEKAWSGTPARVTAETDWNRMKLHGQQRKMNKSVRRVEEGKRKREEWPGRKEGSDRNKARRRMKTH